MGTGQAAPPGTTTMAITRIWQVADLENLTPIIRGGERNALAQLSHVIVDPDWIASFDKPKTIPVTLAAPTTTVLSPFLSTGALSPRSFWYSIVVAAQKSAQKMTKPPSSLQGQLLWREFNNVMARRANATTPGSWGMMQNNVLCRQIPWVQDDVLLAAWKAGRTGYPWIDACMYQLRATGWLHHLGRHAVACFLTRGDLWQPWMAGAAHFEEELLDADYALNNFNWMWVSCSGFFYQYFRCYSPVTFQKNNDKSGAYIRKWCPALAKLPDRFIYEPWKAPLAVQKDAGCIIGKDYPRPIVDHALVSKENMGKMAAAYNAYKHTFSNSVSSSSLKRTRVGKVQKTLGSATKRRKSK